MISISTHIHFSNSLNKVLPSKKLCMELIFLIIFFGAIVLDLTMGELPVNIHPVVWMGKLISYLKTFLIKINSKFSGFILTMLLLILFIVPLILLLKILSFNLIIYIFFSLVILSTTFSIKFLISSIQDIKKDLKCNLEIARQSMSFLVSRDTKSLKKEEIVSAAIETLSENITDSVVAPLFYSVLFGIPGAFIYRIINTLDAMVGYKDEENYLIGYFPAKVDDILNYIPARFTGIILVVSSLILGFNWKNSWKVMIKDAGNTPSPNSGYTMAAVAGALEVSLIKPGVYKLGSPQRDLNPETINDAIKLTKLTIIISIILLIVLQLILLILVFNKAFI
ncbi:cobalamin biosynthesis protein [Methanobacterium alkalithermotolerans]|nr:cobalamin biosynthesis protein [Methanobacterium alkalithermotolerans]